MAADFDDEHIAQVVGVPKTVVRGVINGELDDDVLRDYDPARPPDVRLVKERKFVRSRLVGVLSTGGCGATTLAAALALAAAQNSAQRVGALDLNECAGLGEALGLETLGEKAALYPSISWLSDQPEQVENVEELLVRHPETENLMVLLGAVTAKHHAELSGNLIDRALGAMSRMFTVTWVDCPSSPHLWPHVLPELDMLLYVLRADNASMASLWQTAPVLRSLGVLDRCLLVINCGGSQGWISAADCRRMCRKAADLQVLAVLPEDTRLRLGPVGRAGLAYKDAVASILHEVCPERLPENRPGLMKTLAGWLSR